eukprot:2914957-Lingulodinium_polyedra.AAC.1
MQARGKEDAHRRRREPQGDKAEFQCNYVLLASKRARATADEEAPLTVSTAADRRLGALFAA